MLAAEARRSDRMKIAVVTTSMADGGAQRVAATLSNAWAATGHQVLVMTFEPPGTEPGYPLDDRVSLLQLDLMGDSSTIVQSVTKNLRRARVLRRHLCDYGPDATVALITGPNILAVLASIGRPWPTIISERVHPAHQPLEKSWHLLRRILYPHADAIVVQTNQIADWFKTTLDLEAIVIPNPIDLEKFCMPSEQTRAPDRRNLVIAVGRLERQKGYDLLIAAFARVADANPDWDLLIYGKGPERDVLQNLINSSQLAERIRLAGMTADIASVYAGADLVVHPARYEGYPNVVQEALAAGRPVLATDCPGATRELLGDGRYGMLVPNEDIDALANALAECLPDRERRAGLARSARSGVLAFEAHHIAQRWIDLFDDLIARRARGRS